MIRQGPKYNYVAFISYSHRDMAVAKWLQKRLEDFKLPAKIHYDVEAKGRYLRPVFRDQSDLNTGILSEELLKNLAASRFLILICSRHAAQSKWVSDEAKAFVDMGRIDRIIPIIIPDGNTVEQDLFPRSLREYFAANPERMLLGVDVDEIGKERMLVRVVSKILDVSFDSLWKRHQRQNHIRWGIGSLTVFAVLVLAYFFMIPVTVNVGVTCQQSLLPQPETVMLTVNGADYSADIDSLKYDSIKLPGYKRFASMPVSVSAKYFIPIDTTVRVGYGVTRDIDLFLYRDDTFSRFEGIVFDAAMHPLSNVEVTVAECKMITGADGVFSIALPLSEQRSELPVRLSKSGYKEVVRDDETPGVHIRYIMHEK